ncbi:MAG: hypothetical protein EB141_17430, partial [Verrucomicrobia bacterium]|nr:hypothetical protein [Verrucomicrobiota bacterium]
AEGAEREGQHRAHRIIIVHHEDGGLLARLITFGPLQLQCLFRGQAALQVGAQQAKGTGLLLGQMRRLEGCFHVRFASDRVSNYEVGSLTKCSGESAKFAVSGNPACAAVGFCRKLVVVFPVSRSKIVFSAILAGVVTPASALGLRIADQDPFATARGNAFVATADNPSAIYYNPAGLTQLEGHQLRIGTYAIALKSQFTTPARAVFDTKSRMDFAPQFYYAYGMKDQPLAFGLGFYSPYGLALEWPNNPSFGPVYGKMAYLTLNPVAAWQVHPTLSVAAGLTLNYAELEIRQPALAAPGFPSVNRFKGEDLDAGYNLGLLWQPFKQHSFGVNYRSATTQNFTGSATTSGTGLFDGTGPANARMPLPRHVACGYSFRPTPEWNFEFNADWTEWERMNTVNFVQPVGTFPVPFNWRSSWFYEFGVTRKFEGGWRASAGYIFSENSVPDANFSPLVPDSDRHIFSVGVGRQQTRVNWDVGYQLAWGPGRTVTGNNLAFPLPANSTHADGRYTFLSHAFTAAVGFRF